MNRLTTSAFVWLMVLMAPLVRGEDLILVVTKGGYYTLQSDAAGNPVLKPVKTVIILGEAPTDPIPPTMPGTEFEKAITALTKEVLAAGGTKNTGARIASVYSVVAGGVADGSIPVAKAIDALKIGTDLALKDQPDAAKWATWRGEVGDSLTILAQQGKLQTAAQWSGAMKEVERGMNAATGFVGAAVAREKGMGIFDGIDLAKIMEFIKFLLELFKLFGGK